MPQQEHDLAEGIVQDNLPVHAIPPSAEFKPWHRVRKEFIRRYQWNELTARMIKRYWQKQLRQPEEEWSLVEAGCADGALSIPADLFLDRALRCLVIPGEDLLDVRALWRDVGELNCWISYLGFNESFGSDNEGARVHVANNAVLSLPRVYRLSRVLHDRFQAIQSRESLAYRYLREYGPYHIVNLDLCGSMFPNTRADVEEFYTALDQLLRYQFESQKCEWLLFISTVVEPAVVHAEKLNQLCQPIHNNAQSHADFAEKLRILLPESVFSGAAATIDPKTLTEEQMTRLFGVALGKWLLKLCQTPQPQWTIAMRKSFRYTVNEEKGAVMLSLAFSLKPNITPPVDVTGMSKLERVVKTYPSERECALSLAESVAGIRDVDEILAADAELKSRLRDSQADLLEAAGYDREAYPGGTWVE